MPDFYSHVITGVISVNTGTAPNTPIKGSAPIVVRVSVDSRPEFFDVLTLSREAAASLAVQLTEYLQTP